MELLESSIEVLDVYAKYDSFYAIEAVTIHLNSPFYTLLLGPNGAGKTTLIKVLVGLLKPVRGRVRIYGFDPFKDRANLSKLVGYLPQPGSTRPAPFMRVRDLVAVGYLSHRRPPRYVDKEVEHAIAASLRVIGIENLADKYLTDLSGGELQRASIASVIVRKPKLLVLDEPLASLDMKAKCELIELLLELHRSFGMDIIMSTHELTPCTYFEPTVVLINRTVLSYGPARKVLTSENLKMAYPSMVEVAGLTILTEDHAVRG
ncbi:MAG: ATP-binding cassette domain-containing protein [Sulfolobales archaeon]